MDLINDKVILLLCKKQKECYFIYKLENNFANHDKFIEIITFKKYYCIDIELF